MNKRIAPLLLCFVMVFAMLATAVPAFAEGTTNKGIFTVKADKTSANPGDVINVTLTLTPPSGKLTAFQGFFQADTGLTYVANSGKIPDGLKASLGFDSVDWTEVSKMVNGLGSTVYAGTADIVLAELRYKVDDNAAVGSVLKISLDEIEVCDETRNLVESSVIPATITVTAAPKPATGITLNKSELTLTAGESASLTATVTPEGSTDTVVWSSNKTDVATVDSATGKVTAVAPGEATITATAGTKTATCTVKVQAAPCEHGSIRIEVPFKLTVKKTGEMAPGQETFKFAVEKFGAPTTYTVVQDTVETNGEKTYEGKFIFTIRDDEAGNLSEGFVIRQVKGNAAGWTYDETMFYAVPLFVDSYESVGGWSFRKFDQNNELDYNNPLREIGFTNSYSAKKPVTPPAPEKPDTPPAPQKPESPKTGDGSMMGLSIALVIVSGAALMGTALYSRRKSR